MKRKEKEKQGKKDVTGREDNINRGETDIWEGKKRKITNYIHNKDEETR